MKRVAPPSPSPSSTECAAPRAVAVMLEGKARREAARVEAARVEVRKAAVATEAEAMAAAARELEVRAVATVVAPTAGSTRRWFPQSRAHRQFGVRMRQSLRARQPLRSHCSSGCATGLRLSRSRPSW